MKEQAGINIKMVIRAYSGSDPRRYNLLTALEVTILFHGSGYFNVVANRHCAACILWWYRTYYRTVRMIRYITFCCFPLEIPTVISVSLIAEVEAMSLH